MAKTPQTLVGIQDDIFQDLEKPAFESAQDLGLDIHHELRAAMIQSLKMARRAGITRERVVDRMNQALADQNGKVAIAVTKRKLDAWTAASKEDRPIPAEFIPAFCHACECYLVLRVLAQALLLELADPRDLNAMRLGNLQIRRAEILKETRELTGLLGGSGR